MTQTALGAILAAALLSAVAHARTIYVNGTTGNDDWDGLCEEWDGGTCGPKATIQADAAWDSDEVLVGSSTVGKFYTMLEAVACRSPLWRPSAEAPGATRCLFLQPSTQRSTYDG